jgi:lactate permease
VSWTQLYNPLAGAGLSALAAAAPLIVLFILLASGKLKGWAAALASTAASLLLSITLWRMPASAAVSAAAFGAAFAVFPILWIVTAALWVYSMSVESGQFAVIRRTLAGITPDRRLQALFIAFAFGAFLEGSAGFGTPVAITAAMLVGLGFDARYAAAICLIANSAPVAFAAAGVPVATAAEVSGLDIMAISRVLGLQVPVLSLIVPLWLCVILCGWRRSMEVLPAILVAGLSMAATQLVLSLVSGPFITGVASGLVSTGALALLFVAWKPRRIWEFEGAASREAPAKAGVAAAAASNPGGIGKTGFAAALRAWSPFLLMSVLVLAWGIPFVKRLLDSVGFSVPWPRLHGLAVRTAPVTSRPAPPPPSLASQSSRLPEARSSSRGSSPRSSFRE